MDFKFVEYHSHEWELLVSRNCNGYGWITWEVIEFQGKRLAKMVWTKF